MKQTLMIWLAISCFSLIGSTYVDAGTKPASPDTGKNLALHEINLLKPSLEADAQYLGVDSFFLNQIKAQVLIIDVFNMYCTHCQREAPKANELYELVESSGWGDKVKIIGIGAGNSDFEVQIYRKKYNVPFPLFADKDYTITKKCLEELRTPYFLALKIDTEKNLNLIYSQAGAFENALEFLDHILHQSHLK